MFSRKVTRLVQKAFGLNDVDAFLKEINDASSADGISEYVKALLANFSSPFLETLDKVYAEHDDKHRQAMRNLQISSDELNETNYALERLNISMDAVLQSLGQGLLFFDKTGICSPIYSKSCLTLLEKNPTGKHISEVLELAKEPASSLTSLIELVFNPSAGALSFDDLVGLAPQQYNHSEGLLISLQYRPMRSMSGMVIGILVIATDVTQEAAARDALLQKEIHTVRILRIARNRDDYIRHLRNFTTAVSTLGEERPLEDIQRDLHTLKGMAKVFNLDNLAAVMHHLEDALRDIMAVEGTFGAFTRVLASYQKRLDAALEEARSYARDLWGDDFDKQTEHISIETKRLLGFARNLQTMSPEDISSGAVARLYFDTVASISVQELLYMFQSQLEYFGEMADKEVRVRYSNKDDARIFPDFYKDFLDSLVHIARNIIDHAAEPPAERERQGKPPELQINIDISYHDAARDQIRIELSDDGKGINVNKLTSRLKKTIDEDTLNKLSTEEIYQHIFDAGLTTQDNVSIDSGRGVGLNAVKTEVEKIGGNVSVASVSGEGTKFTIILPVIWADERIESALDLHIVKNQAATPA